MKTILIAALLSGAVGCADSAEVWSLEADESPSSAACGLRGATVYLQDHGDGDFDGQMTVDYGEMEIRGAHGSYAIAIVQDDLSVDLELARTDGPGDWPASLTGTAHVARPDSEYHAACDGVVGVHGLEIDRDDYIKSHTYTMACPNYDDCPVAWSLDF